MVRAGEVQELGGGGRGGAGHELISQQRQEKRCTVVGYQYFKKEGELLLK